MKNVAFIINPFSSSGNYQPFLDELLQKSPDANYFVSDSIEGTDHFIDENFQDTEIFAAIGGDGTISTVARKLINTDKVLAIFPAGSGNGFSREMHFKKNLDNLFQKIDNRNIRKVDSFLVNNHFSINVSGTGFDGKVVKEFEKTSRGFQNYIRVTLKTFFNYKPIEITFRNPELQIHNGEYLMLNIANTRQFGNNAYIAPAANFADGKVEIVLVKKFPIHYYPLFAYRMFTKGLKDDDFITYISTSEIEFDVNTSDWHIDGEFNSIISPIHVKVLPQSLNILY